MKIGFALLHYNNIMVTKTAVEYLQKLNCHEQIQIIIVDNCSPNGSGEALIELYKASNNVHVILNTENIGFAKGNNIGYLYAKNIGCDAIVVMNSDVFIKDFGFCEKLEARIAEESAYIIAPRIIGKCGDQNPFRKHRIRTRSVLRILGYNLVISCVYKIPTLNEKVAVMLNKRKNRKVAHQRQENEIWAPHGSCIVYTKKWIEKENIAFVPITFMYFEEDILAEYISKRKYKIEYAKELIVYHMEDASIDSISSISVDKRRFISSCMVSSIASFLKFRYTRNISE